MALPVWAVQIIVSLVAAVLSAYLARTNVQGPTPSDQGVPDSKDGTVIRKIYGTVWVDDSQVLAWKPLDPEPIKKKAGKK